MTLRYLRRRRRGRRRRVRAVKTRMSSVAATWGGDPRVPGGHEEEAGAWGLGTAVKEVDGCGGDEKEDVGGGRQRGYGAGGSEEGEGSGDEAVAAFGQILPCTRLRGGGEEKDSKIKNNMSCFDSFRCDVFGWNKNKNDSLAKD